jgi:NIMA (never in mitosis gene a)-related kinase
VGCIVYEMITLKPPFQAEDMQGLYKQVIKGKVDPLPKKYSEDLAFIVKALLQVNAENRPTCE